MVEFSNSPKGWLLTNLESISEIILGQSPPSSTYNENGEGLPFYQGKLEFGEIYPIPQKWCSSPKKIAEKGDVLISVRAPVGPTNVCPGKSCIGRGFAAIRGIGGISPFFILYLIYIHIIYWIIITLHLYILIFDYHINNTNISDL